jgi:hypothetical protein
VIAALYRWAKVEHVQLFAVALCPRILERGGMFMLRRRPNFEAR